MTRKTKTRLFLLGAITAFLLSIWFHPFPGSLVTLFVTGAYILLATIIWLAEEFGQ